MDFLEISLFALSQLFRFEVLTFKNCGTNRVNFFPGVFFPCQGEIPTMQICSDFEGFPLFFAVGALNIWDPLMKRIGILRGIPRILKPPGRKPSISIS